MLDPIYPTAGYPQIGVGRVVVHRGQGWAGVVRQGCGVPSRCPDFDRIWPAIAAEQDGVVARRQLLAAGLTPGVSRREVVARRWRVLYPGVYATFSGTVPDRAQIWAALLRAGSGAVAAHRTALWLAGVIDERPDVIEVAIPHDRKPTRPTACGYTACATSVG